jgi:anti-sigma regulatory factor (Ser/Thr protein kinase)
MSEPFLGQPDFDLDFRKGTEAARDARQAVRSLLGSTHGDLAADAELVVSELVTNVVRHTENGGTVRARRTAEGVRVEVSDSDRRQPVLGGGRADTTDGGRGLRVVDHVASAWGVEPLQPAGKTVWAEISAEARPP